MKVIEKFSQCLYINQIKFIWVMVLCGGTYNKTAHYWVLLSSLCPSLRIRRDFIGDGTMYIMYKDINTVVEVHYRNR